MKTRSLNNFRSCSYNMNINDLTGEIIGAAIEVHKALGPVPALWNLFIRNVFVMNLTKFNVPVLREGIRRLVI